MKPDDSKRFDATVAAIIIRARERRAEAVRDDGAAILDVVRALAGDALQAGGFAVAGSVGAHFRAAESGTTGIELTVQLEDPAQADRAADALAARFGGLGPPDAIIVY